MKYSYPLNQIIEQETAAGKAAIIGADKTLTWKELGEIAHQVGAIVDTLQIPQGHPVMIYGHKEALFPAIILGLMLKNIPYIPIDKLYPSERIKKVIEISGTQVIFNCCADQLTLFDGLTVIDRHLDIHKQSEINFSKIYGGPDDPLRYIIFTSGSTGEPKGVQITQNALISFMHWIDHDFALDGDDVFMNQAPFSFDLSVYELSMYLHFGGTILLNEADLLKDNTAFVNRLQKYKPSVWISTPSFAYLLLRESMFNEQDLPSIKTFLFCGETLPVQTAQKLLNLFPQSRVLNTYGPTEATVATTLINITTDIIKKYSSSLPVGYCKRDTELLIVNETNNPSELGEIAIVGDNVSIGYLNQPQLTDKVFFKHNNKSAYLTGDNGYIRDGMLFHFGRIDDQVKLNGFRIELNEISAVIRNLPYVEDAVTVALKKDQQVKKIISFIILNKGNQPSPDQLKKQVTAELAKKLPAYMIPTDIKEVEHFPMSSNHKIDKKNLIDSYIQGL